MAPLTASARSLRLYPRLLRYGVRRRVFALLTISMAAGCGTAPQAAVSDPLVYTTLEMQAAEEALPPLVKLDAALERYFLATPEDYATDKLRIDTMLDNSQRTAGFYDHVGTFTKLRLVASLMQPVKADPAPADDQSGGDDSTDDTKPDEDDPSGTPGDDTPAAGESADTSTNASADSDTSNATEDEQEDKQEDDGVADDDAAQEPAKPRAVRMTPEDAEKWLKLVDSLVASAKASAAEGLVADSPTDQIDRVTDFYTAYLIKYLRRTADSRVLVAADGSRMTAGRTLYAVTPEPSEEAQEPLEDGRARLVLLVMQSHVYPGSRPDAMVGVRAFVTGGTRANGTCLSPDDVEIVRVHPARAYDLELAGFAQSIDQAADLSALLTFPVKGNEATLEGSRESVRQQQERREFYTRLGKHGSYANAATHSFGWNFFPTNVEVVKRNAFSFLFGWIGGQAGNRQVRSFLEPGGRDCAVYLIVPRDTNSITCVTQTFHASVSRDGLVGPERWGARSDPFTIPLPSFDPAEVRAAAAGPAPFRAEFAAFDAAAYQFERQMRRVDIRLAPAPPPNPGEPATAGSKSDKCPPTPPPPPASQLLGAAAVKSARKALDTGGGQLHAMESRLRAIEGELTKLNEREVDETDLEAVHEHHMALSRAAKDVADVKSRYDTAKRAYDAQTKRVTKAETDLENAPVVSPAGEEEREVERAIEPPAPAEAAK